MTDIATPQKPFVVVLGGIESGVGAALLAQKQQYSVFVSDKGTIPIAYKQVLEQHGIRFEENQHDENLILTADIVVKSPGIPEKAPIIQQIRAKGITLVSEIEFAARHTTVPIIAITGSNGKTTTTSLTYHLLEQAGLSVQLGGNIGESFAKLVATQPPPSYYVLEVSSFQLDDIQTFAPHIAMITNITPDHLDRYNYRFEEYVVAKFRIAAHQKNTDHLILGIDNPAIQEHLQQNLHFSEAQQYRFSIEDDASVAFGTVESMTVLGKKISLQQFPLSGKHNRYNALCAALVARILGIDAATIEKGLNSFEALENRLEPVATRNDVLYINDSKATNIDSAWYALDGMTRPIVWIAGGTDKGNDYGLLYELVQQKVRAIVCMCVDSSKIKAAFSPLGIPIVDALSATEAVQQSQQLAQKGDVVLLSPACASFDLFQNYVDRGNKFRESVLALT
jgi:UDP-N-acetylmuramoylalanine--D-glutamate ligase